MPGRVRACHDVQRRPSVSGCLRQRCHMEARWLRAASWNVPPTLPPRASAGANPASGPHVYGIGAATYRGLLDAKSQSVIISGESGAGKTETAKRFLQYLAYRGVCIVWAASRLAEASPSLLWLWAESSMHLEVGLKCVGMRADDSDPARPIPLSDPILPPPGTLPREVPTPARTESRSA